MIIDGAKNLFRKAHCVGLITWEMSEYWKSLPRKFCEACKCWFADNKASIEFHERGKRHKENVEKRLALLCKKGKKDFDDTTRYEKAMAKIEQAAMAAFKKDVENDPTLVPKPKVLALGAILEDVKNLDVSIKEWWEGKDEDGNMYYWNATSGESQWEPPRVPFISLEEQEAEAKEQSTVKEKEDAASSPEPAVEQGPQQRAEPYGKWTTVQTEPAKPLDLQLPVLPNDLEEIPEKFNLLGGTEEEPPKNRFKEKTIESLGKTLPSGGNSDGTFRKRKNLSETKRNVRRRADDE